MQQTLRKVMIFLCILFHFEKKLSYILNFVFYLQIQLDIILRSLKSLSMKIVYFRETVFWLVIKVNAPTVYETT